jgi:hypothetical protein
MATSYLILGQAAPTSGNTDLYSSPAATQTVVSTITITNVTGTSANASIYVRKATGTTPATASAANAIALAMPVPANSLQTITIGLTLGAYDTISVGSGTSSALTFQAFGSQVTA